MKQPRLPGDQPYSYVPTILGKLALTFEWHRQRYPELQLIESSVLSLIEAHTPAHQATSVQSSCIWRVKARY